MKDAGNAPKSTEKIEKLKNMFFFYLFDLTWKLAVSFLTPFFAALVWANGDIAKIIVGVLVGLFVSILTIINEVKQINKVMEKEVAK